MTSGKFSPGSIFLDFGVAQAVVVGGDIGLEQCPLLLQFFLSKKFIQNRRLRISVPPSRFLLQVSESSRGKRECAPLLNI